MKNIAFIPVRCGSKSIPFKNIKPFCGRPLVYWVTKAASISPSIDEVWVATDCVQIENIVNQFGLDKVNVYRRQPTNANDQSSTESVMLEFVEWSTLDPTTAFVLLQATSPFTSPTDIDGALSKYNQEDYNSILSAVMDTRFYWGDDGQPINYNYRNRKRRQDIENRWMENGAIYINSVERILKDKNRLSTPIGIYPMPQYTGHELDEPHDWIIGEALMRQYL